MADKQQQHPGPAAGGAPGHNDEILASKQGGDEAPFENDEEKTSFLGVCEAAFDGWCYACRQVVAGMFTPMRVLSGAAGGEESPKKE